MTDVEELAEMDDVTEGDQAKVRVLLKRSEFASWPEHKARLMEIADEKGVAIFSCELREKPGKRRRSKLEEDKQARGMSTMDVLGAFCEERRIGEDLEWTAKKLLES